MLLNPFDTEIIIHILNKSNKRMIMGWPEETQHDRLPCHAGSDHLLVKKVYITMVLVNIERMVSIGVAYLLKL